MVYVIPFDIVNINAINTIIVTFVRLKQRNVLRPHEDVTLLLPTFRVYVYIAMYCLCQLFAVLESNLMTWKFVSAVDHFSDLLWCLLANEHDHRCGCTCLCVSNDHRPMTATRMRLVPYHNERTLSISQHQHDRQTRTLSSVASSSLPSSLTLIRTCTIVLLIWCSVISLTTSSLTSTISSWIGAGDWYHAQLQVRLSNVIIHLIRVLVT
jgi:hypothetical protein